MKGITERRDGRHRSNCTIKHITGAAVQINGMKATEQNQLSFAYKEQVTLTYQALNCKYFT